MSRSRVFHFLAAFVGFVALVQNARADGGVVRWREAKGPFLVTVFSASELVQGGPADISVMAQDQNSSEVVLDANVVLKLTPPAGAEMKTHEEMCGGKAMAPLIEEASHKQASNKLLYAAPVTFDAPGNWRLEASISRGGEKARFACDIPVAPASPQWTALGPWLAFPPVAIALFALNQFLRARRALPFCEP